MTRRSLTLLVWAMLALPTATAALPDVLDLEDAPIDAQTTQNAEASLAAASLTGDAVAGGVAFSVTGDSEGTLAISVTGRATGYVPVSVFGQACQNTLERVCEDQNAETSAAHGLLP